MSPAEIGLPFAGMRRDRHVRADRKEPRFFDLPFRVRFCTEMTRLATDAQRHRVGRGFEGAEPVGKFL